MSRLRCNDFSASGLGRHRCLRVRQRQPAGQSQEVNVKSQPQEVKAFFVAGKEAHYLALQCPTSGYVDLSAYSHLMEIKYPPTFQVDVLRKAPSRPYKSFAVLECKPGPHSRSEEMLEGLKGKAREIGADAIILCQGRSGPGTSRNAADFKNASRGHQVYVDEFVR